MTPALEVTEARAFHLDRMLVLDEREDAWLTFAAPWWAVLRWLWWVLTPGEKTWVLLRRCEGEARARVRAVRVSRQVVRPGKVAT